MRRKRLIRSSLSILAVALSFAAAPAFAANYFPRDLRQGDEGRDVKNLQIALNAIYQTRIAESGPGSPGAESEFFGEKTAAAVSRFQEMRGFTPTGVVAGETRQALQGVLEWAFGAEKKAATSTASAATSSPATTSQPPALPTPAAEEVARRAAIASEPIIFTNMLPALESGRAATIRGYNLREGEKYNIVIASSSKVFAEATATTSLALSFRAPRLKRGDYVVYVQGSNGRSGEFTLSLGAKTRPVIKRVTPAIIHLGDTVTIEGNRFGRKGVKVVTSLGTVSDAKVKGQKIVFTSTLGATLPKPEAASGSTATIPVSLRVENDRGQSDFVIVHVAL